MILPVRGATSDAQRHIRHTRHQHLKRLKGTAAEYLQTSPETNMLSFPLKKYV